MRRSLLIWGGCLALMSACDQRPSGPVAVVPTQPPPVVIPEDARPTTQEILLGPRKPLQLPNMPLSVRVPQSWKIEMTGPLTILTGPTPFDKAMIQLVQRDSTPNDVFEPLIQRMMKADLSDETPLRAPELRELGKARVLERISIGKPISAPLLDHRGDPRMNAKGEIEMLTTTPMTWRLSVFIPGDKAVSWYELNLVGFNKEQYESDHLLIEEILHSLTTDSGSAPATAPPL